jgi:SAM-dependent methyltransferase
MYSEDVTLLACPWCHAELRCSNIPERGEDGEILEGAVVCIGCDRKYAVHDGIPRLADNVAYNWTWDYKWVEIDRGRGLNYKILDKSDPAYRIHDLYDRNSHGGNAYSKLKDALALDIGCGVGQYTIRMLKDGGAAKVVAMDLTRGVDIFRKIVFERYPEFRRRVVFVQGSALAMPFKDSQFDYVLSFGVLMHTGRTLEAIRQAARVLRDRGDINFWVYSAASVHNEVREPEGRDGLMTFFSFIPYQLYFAKVTAQINLFRFLPHSLVVKIIRMFSSNFWYRVCTTPILRWFGAVIFYTVKHPDKEYRFINNYDGWCNSWAENWSEQELFRAICAGELAIKGMSDWRVGIWAEKVKGFYPANEIHTPTGNA